jgi:hypothetical protein
MSILQEVQSDRESSFRYIGPNNAEIGSIELKVSRQAAVFTKSHVFFFIITHHIVKMYAGVEVYLNAF